MAFSAREVSWREWVALGSGLVAVGTLFLPWTNLTATNQDAEEALRESPAGEVARNAFTTGFLAYAGPLLLLLAGIAVAVLGQNRKARVSGLPHLWLIASLVALVLMVLGWVVIDRQFDEDARLLLEQGGVGIYGGFGRYLALVCCLVSLFAATWDVRLARRRGTPANRR
ncbi:hypothetical protein HFP15_17915 [Amycolatopsis sp. K13G38]|uniref:Uncharacterized protein n=1 Tax=Amycolatopsis acididurans TaxID=2724524 RepID=A0ABX1J4R8_9PSEU|nr:hypothetical protein [Amycolatopsis acididurans]NKQ54763.1 hypothetical protein [Amycolatopsis acididurans]